ncbi:hypothetical protein LTR17_011860 [Elasticomyces elasticus]|nr:hypothetical protein LTR17_011860 [Elasticomyces elasticus]
MSDSDHINVGLDEGSLRQLRNAVGVAKAAQQSLLDMGAEPSASEQCAFDDALKALISKFDNQAIGNHIDNRPTLFRGNVHLERLRTKARGLIALLKEDDTNNTLVGQLKDTLNDMRVKYRETMGLSQPFIPADDKRAIWTPSVDKGVEYAFKKVRAPPPSVTLPAPVMPALGMKIPVQPARDLANQRGARQDPEDEGIDMDEDEQRYLEVFNPIEEKYNTIEFKGSYERSDDDLWDVVARYRRDKINRASGSYLDGSPVGDVVMDDVPPITQTEMNDGVWNDEDHGDGDGDADDGDRDRLADEFGLSSEDTAGDGIKVNRNPIFARKALRLILALLYIDDGGLYHAFHGLVWAKANLLRLDWYLPVTLAEIETLGNAVDHTIETLLNTAHHSPVAETPIAFSSGLLDLPPVTIKTAGFYNVAQASHMFDNVWE